MNICVFILIVGDWIEEPLIRKEDFKFDDIIDVSNKQTFGFKEVRFVLKLNYLGYRRRYSKGSLWIFQRLSWRRCSNWRESEGITLFKLIVFYSFHLIYSLSFEGQMIFKI